MPDSGTDLAFCGSNLCKECLGHFSTLHFLLNLVINGGIDVHSIVLWFPIPLSGKSRCFHLQNIFEHGCHFSLAKLIQSYSGWASKLGTVTPFMIKVINSAVIQH